MHEYLRRLILAHQNGVIPERSIGDAYVMHDDDCKSFDGGKCGCDPHIRLDLKTGPMWVLADGTATTEKPV